MPKKIDIHQIRIKLDQLGSGIILLGDYTNVNIPTTFVCASNHIWSAAPRNVVYGRSGCPHCSGKAKKTTAVFEKELEQINAIRGYRVRLVDGQQYVSSFVPVKLMCDIGHIWYNTPSNVINSSQGCKRCEGKAKKTTKEFIVDLLATNADIKLVDNQEYVDAHTKLQFSCNKMHTWYTMPITVLLGHSCPHCVRKGYSKKSIMWLESIAAQYNLIIQHAENGGEYLIPGTKFYADGFCLSTNTVYEFHGDVFHGNPNIFNLADKCHPYNKNYTAQFLYDRTKRRELIIKELGYNLVTIWEHDYDIQC